MLKKLYDFLQKDTTSLEGRSFCAVVNAAAEWSKGPVPFILHSTVRHLLLWQLYQRSPAVSN
jgi:hypothetical protein